mmetsp:Transcript_7835/g.19441  ORF Transcript_7835/g.19441 Transcript_7835/m.19441 type:complete len:234 (-) Transcript_7835:630-1331(-)
MRSAAGKALAAMAAHSGEIIASGYLTRSGTCWPRLSFTHVPSPGSVICASGCAANMKSGAPSAASAAAAPPEAVAKTGIIHSFSSPAAGAEPSARNQPCLSLSVTPPPAAALASSTSSRGKPICVVHWPIMAVTGLPEASSHAFHRSPVVALPYLNSCMYARSPCTKCSLPTTACTMRTTEPPLQYEIASKTCSTSSAFAMGTWIGWEERSASSCSARPCMSVMNCSHMLQLG